MEIGFLGPLGTFTEIAVNKFGFVNNKIPYRTIQDVLFAIQNNEIVGGVVPIQNTTEGIVNVTIDTLIFDTNLYIQKQLILPIKHNLMINKNNINNKVNKILSHPQALAQCRNFLNKNFLDVEIIEVSSTSKAAEIVSQTDDFSAAISNDFCEKIYNLKTINTSIEDNKNNKTLFIYVSKNITNIPSLNKKISLAFSIFDKPGELYKILDIFSLWDINITQISSRPMKNSDGEYVFFVDIENIVNEKDCKDALTMVKRKSNLFKVLGVYEVL